MNSNRNLSFSKRLIKFNNRKSNKSTMIKSKNKFDELKESLSFNSFSIYNQNLNNYSIENTLNDLLIKRMADISFISGSSSKNKPTKKQRINLINVNNYFSPQINIIKVNKLNEKKIVDNKSKEKRKENNKRRVKENECNIIQNYNSFKFMKSSKEKNTMSKIKLIQTWWKGIYNIIKIQKNIRGFLYRNKLLENLEKEKIIICNIFFLYKTIRKFVINLIFEKLRKFIYKRNNSPKKGSLNMKKILKGTTKVKDITNITYINNYNNNFINNFKLDKEKLNIKDILTINDNNSNNYQSKNKGNNSIKYYSIHPKLFNINKAKNLNNYKIIKNISFINNINTNNINNNYFYNKYNSKYIQKKDNINDQIFPRIKKFLKNKYSLTKNKSTFENSLNNLTNITIYTNKNKKEYIDYLKYKYNKKKFNNKIPVKSRNFIEINKSNISSNYLKNKNIIFGDYKNVTSKMDKNSKKKKYNIIDSYKMGNIQDVKINKMSKTKYNFFSNSNNIKNNRNENIKNKNEKMIYNNKLNMIKKDKNYIARYYISLWKEITEKQIILQKLKNNIDFSLTLKSSMLKTIKQKLYNSKIKKFKSALFQKGLGLLIKKILNKCILYKYFILLNHKVNRIQIFKKLKIFLKFKSKYNNSENDIDLRLMEKKEQNKLISKRIKCKKKINIEKINNNNKLLLSSSLISFNKMKLLNHKKKNINNNLNYSNQNLKINPKIKINRSINNNLIKLENNRIQKNDIKDIKNPNLIMQINQLKMIFNLLELHNKRKKTFIYYFKRWKNKLKKNGKTNESQIEDNKTHIMMDRNRNLTTKYRIMKYFSPYKKEYKDYSYKKNYSLYSKDSKDKSRFDFTNDSKINLNNTNNNNSNIKNNNESINFNMIYKKKLVFDGYRTSRNNIIDYSALLEGKNSIYKHNNDNINYDKNNNQNTCNLFNQTMNNTSFGERFYKRINKIEEREIFFNKEIIKDAQYDKKTYKNKNFGNDKL